MSRTEPPDGRLLSVKLARMSTDSALACGSAAWSPGAVRESCITPFAPFVQNPAPSVLWVSAPPAGAWPHVCTDRLNPSFSRVVRGGGVPPLSANDVPFTVATCTPLRYTRYAATG